MRTWLLWSLRLARRLISRYDRPELDSKLSRDELGIDAERFERADGDGDLALDSDELIHWLADVEPEIFHTCHVPPKAVRFSPAVSPGFASPM